MTSRASRGWKLFLVEWIKTTRRTAVQGALIVYVLLLGAIFAQRMARMDSRISTPFRLPEAWPLIVQAGDRIPALFIAILIAYLIATEFETRTERQSLIAGFSRPEFYAAKVIVWFAVSTGAYLLMVGLGASLALLSTPEPWSGQLVTRPDLLLLIQAGGTFVATTSLAVTAAFWTRNTVLSVGLCFLYYSLIELLIRSALSAFAPTVSWAEWLPGIVFERLQGTPTSADVLAATAWVLLFILAPRLTYRAR